MLNLSIETFMGHTLFNDIEVEIEINEIEENIKSREDIIDSLFPKGTIVRELYFAGVHFYEELGIEEKELERELEKEKNINGKICKIIGDFFGNDNFMNHMLSFDLDSDD